MRGRSGGGGLRRLAVMRDRVVGRLLGLPRVQVLRSVLDGYGAAGGGLLAAGLAYAGLFALVPGVLLILGIGGLVLGDGELHDTFVESVVAVIPPLRDLLGPALSDLRAQAGSTTLIGAIGLAWGASRFYDAFERAIARVFGNDDRRGFVARTLLGVLSVILLGAAFWLVTILTGLRAFIDAAVGEGAHPLAGLAGILMDMAGLLVVVAALACVYRLVPSRRPRWAAVILPAAAVSISLVAIVRLFVFLAPRLIGAAAVLGTLATVFVALAWLSITFQAVLLGAAWVHARDPDRPGDLGHPVDASTR